MGSPLPNLKKFRDGLAAVSAAGVERKTIKVLLGWEDRDGEGRYHDYDNGTCPGVSNYNKRFELAIVDLETFEDIVEDGELCTQCQDGFALTTLDDNKPLAHISASTLNALTSFMNLSEPPSTLDNLQSWVQIYREADWPRVDLRPVVGFDEFAQAVEDKARWVETQMRTVVRNSSAGSKILRALAEEAVKAREALYQIPGDEADTLVLQALDARHRQEMVQALLQTGAVVVGKYGNVRSFAASLPTRPLYMACLMWFEDSDYQQLPLAVHMALSEKGKTRDVLNRFLTLTEPMTDVQFDTFKVFMEDNQGRDVNVEDIYLMAINV